MSDVSFSAAFDAIEIDPARAPSPAAIEAAMALCASTDEPGFYLLDDCGGRFVVDREFGFISLKHDATLEAERGEIRGVRLKVVEHSGASYELVLRLRISGRVPQVVSEAEAPSAPTPNTPPLAPAPAHRISWGQFTGFFGADAEPFACTEDAPFTLPVAQPCAQKLSGADLTLAEQPPLPADASALWCEFAA